MGRAGIGAGLLLGVCSLLASAAAQAQDSISEVTVIAGGSSGIQPPPGYTKMPMDLNEDAGGAYIYLCYKRGPGAPITGLAVTREGSPPPSDAVWTRIDVDLNQGAGGDYVWLWYTKDPACGTVHDLALTYDMNVPAGYTLIPFDLNSNAGGEYIYLSYQYY